MSGEERVTLGVVVVMLLLLSVGIRSCWRHDIARNRACAQVGGTWITGTDTPSGCFRVNMTLEPVQLGPYGW